MWTEEPKTLGSSRSHVRTPGGGKQQLLLVLGSGPAAACPSLLAPLSLCICRLAAVRAPSAGGGGGGPRVFSFIYCLLFLQIQASAAPSGSRGFTLKVSSCVLFSASFRHPFVFIFGFSIPPPSSAHPSCAGFWGGRAGLLGPGAAGRD